MAQDGHEIHAKLAAHEVQIDGHRRELDDLWTNDKTRSEQITKVRIEIAKWLGLGAVFFAIVNAVVAKFTIEAITRALGGQ
jgi:hypothetical protein